MAEKEIDPNDTLMKLRQFATRFRDDPYPPTNEAEDILDGLYTNFTHLDRWLRAGGALPDEWKNAAIPDRKTQ